MAVTTLCRLFVLALLCVSVRGYGYKIPEQLEVEAFQPKGIRFRLPDAANIVFFSVQGIVVRFGEKVRNFAGETSDKYHVGDKFNWVVEIPDLELKKQDEVKYLAFVAVKNAGYIRDNLHFEVNEFKDYVPLTKRCAVPTITRVRDSLTTICPGDTIFEENFDALYKTVWLIEEYIPTDHPESPFVSYQQFAVTLKDRNLLITMLSEVNETASLYGSLNLTNDCTSTDNHQCILVEGQGAVIPPVISGRIISKPSFAFTYGTVTVRAKLPKGDWIYPEILLEPLKKKSVAGKTETSILKIASARGNAENGNKVLYGGPVLNTTCHDAFFVTKNADTFWSDDFHVYSMQWTPDRVILSVDGEEYGRIEDMAGLRSRLPASCAAESGSTAPFDEYFYLTIGLAVGGRTEFTDSNQTNSTKPWKNDDPEAAVKFWNASQSWRETWQQPELLVDYVKVTAL